MFAAAGDAREVLDDFGAHKVRNIVLSMGAYPPASMPGEPPHRRSTLFSQTMTHQVGSDGASLVVGSNDVRAALLQFGGIITAKSGGALTVPVHPDAQGKRARDFGNLVLVKRQGAPSLLIRPVGGSSKRFDLMFVLMFSVRIAARPYLFWTEGDEVYLVNALQKHLEGRN